MLLDIVALWIWDAWREALAAWSFSLPAVDVEREVAHLAVAATGALLLLFSAAAIRHLPRPARRGALALLIPVLLLPAVLMAGERYGDVTRAGVAKAIAALRNAAQPAISGATVAERSAGRRPPLPVTLPPPKPLDQSVPAVTPSPPAEIAVVAPVPPSVPVPATEQPRPAAEVAGATIKRLSSYLVRKTALSRDTRVVSVLYGTDRAADAGAGVLDYTGERSGHLTLGRVLVSKPDGVAASGGDAAAVSQVRAMPHEEVAAAARLDVQGARQSAGRALIYVHGFNTSFKEAAVAAAGIAQALQFDGALFVYSWASAAPEVQYRHDVQSVSQTAPPLSEFLAFAAQESGARSVTIVADGLGAAAVVEVLSTVNALGAARPAIDQLILRAPDIEREVFAGKVPALEPVVRRITLYASAGDRALNVSRRYVGLIPRAGDVTPSGPAVFAGVETVDLSQPWGDAAPGLAAGAWPPVLYADLRARLAAEPELRNTERRGLEAVATARGTYWRMPPAPKLP